MHTYIHNQKRGKLEFTKDEIDKLFEKDDISQELLQQLNSNLLDILNNTDNEFWTEIGTNVSIELVEQLNQLVKEKTANIRNDILNKYLLSENLHLLMSNGCSIYAGSQAINMSKENEFTMLLENFIFPYELIIPNKEEMQEIIRNLRYLRPEQALDRLYEILSFYENVYKLGEEELRHVQKLIRDVKDAFIRNYVLTIDYNKNTYHKILLKRLVSRGAKLKKVNVFTLNYDLLVEKTAEELGINVNNGFVGFHYRALVPSSFHIDTHINYTNGERSYTKGINLFKLHGSLSWKFDDDKAPFGITENQLDFNLLSQGKFSNVDEIPECIIYPVQSKKKYSLDLPYSEMFRQFIEFVNKPESTMLIMGYSFLDEHVNDIITNALSSPDFNLIIFTYENIEDHSISIPAYLRGLHERSKEDSRITIFSGKLLGNFEFIVRYLIPYPFSNEQERIILETLKKIKE